MEQRLISSDGTGPWTFSVITSITSASHQQADGSWSEYALIVVNMLKMALHYCCTLSSYYTLILFTNIKISVSQDLYPTLKFQSIPWTVKMNGSINNRMSKVGFVTLET